MKNTAARWMVRLELEPERQLAGPRAADFIQGTETCEPSIRLVERLAGLSKIREVDAILERCPRRREHRMVEPIEVFGFEIERNTIRELESPADGEVQLVDGIRPETVARRIAILPGRRINRRGRVQAPAIGLRAVRNVNRHARNQVRREVTTVVR